MNDTTDIRDKFLRYESDSTDIAPAASLVFGELVKLAAPILTSYHGDLYHDAAWLQKYMKGPTFTFFYAVDEAGTSIGIVAKFVFQRSTLRRAVTVTNTNGRITFTAIPQ